MIVLDERGKQCPLPVIDAKKALEGAAPGEYVQVMVDNEIAVQNLKKLADHKGLHCDFMKLAADNFMVNLLKPGSNPGGAVQGGPGLADTDEAQSWHTEEEPVGCQPDQRVKGRLVVVSSACMGSGNEELGKILMKGFLYALTQQDTLPECMIFYNGGAELTTEGSESLEDLRELEAQGVEILTCGTCLKHLGLESRLQVGSVSNMYEIAERMSAARHIIRP